MAFEGLSEKLSNAFKKLKNKGKLSENDVKEAMREVRLALLEADVNYKVAKELTAKITERAVGQDVMESLTPGQMVVKIVNEELTELMGGDNARIEFASKPPTVIMLCGLQGSGKTTHAAKLALMLKNQNHRPLLVACDIYRPAAIDQLKIVGKQANTQVFEKGTQNPVKTAKQAVDFALKQGFDTVIIDTAGRLHINEELMNELKKIKAEVKPTEILLTVDAMTGQDAVNVAKAFNDELDITGVIITKLDGDTRGGAALSIKAICNKPIKFCGVGEKIGDIEPFYPDRIASRILGMGDVLSLIEKAQNAVDEESAKKLEQSFRQNTFTFEDYLVSVEQIKKMGNLKDILSMLPGVSNKISSLDIDEKQIVRNKAIIQSMTKKERLNPDLIKASQKKRIAQGSGTSIQDVNMLLKQFEQSKEMMKQLKGKKGLKGMF